MNSLKHTVLLVIVCSCFLVSASTFPTEPRKNKRGNGYRVNFGTGLGFYHLNEKHAYNPKQKMNGLLGFRRELRVSRDFKAYFMFGLDYVFHGLTYQSYYFKPDSVKLYNRRFNYDYTVYVHEMQMPLQMKYLLRREDNSLFSPYLLFGYHLRYLFASNVKVTGDGKIYQQDSPQIRFRTYLFGPLMNSSLGASLGWQINRLGDIKGGFFAEINFQYGFSDFYFESEYSANSVYINCTQAIIIVGAKF